jgi:translation elongation factor EF-4
MNLERIKMAVTVRQRVQRLKSGDELDYVVLALRNTTRPAIGDTLTEAAVHELIRGGMAVNIIDRKPKY